MKLLYTLILSAFFISCSTEPKEVHGCLDSTACNYNPLTTLDNNSCEYGNILTGACDCDTTTDADIEEIMGNWVVQEYSIGESILFSGNDCCIYDLSPNWVFQSNQQIEVDVANAYFPDGTGERKYGEWAICDNKIRILFEPIVDNIGIADTLSVDGSFSNTINYFNSNLFNYSISIADSHMIFTDLIMTCSAGDTTLILMKYGGDNSISADCAGVANGNNEIDNCGVCDNDASNDCITDCTGVWGGTAAGDVCDEFCYNLESGEYLELDECNVCGGDNSICTDCAGVVNGDALVDNCGTCDSDGSNDCVQDCAGVWGGFSYLDECGGCDANVNNDGFMDDCGVCDIDILNNCTQDCAGVWGGSSIVNCAGACGNVIEVVELWGEYYDIDTTYYINFNIGDFTGLIPREIGCLTNLIELYLHANYFTGEIPPEIGNLTNLTGLDLSSNQLTGEIPPEIGSLTNLTNLSLRNNQLTGEIPPEVCDLIESNNLNLEWGILEGNNLINTCE